MMIAFFSLSFYFSSSVAYCCRCLLFILLSMHFSSYESIDSEYRPMMILSYSLLLQCVFSCSESRWNHHRANMRTMYDTNHWHWLFNMCNPCHIIHSHKFTIILIDDRNTRENNESHTLWNCIIRRRESERTRERERSRASLSEREIRDKIERQREREPWRRNRSTFFG